MSLWDFINRTLKFQVNHLRQWLTKEKCLRFLHVHCGVYHKRNSCTKLKFKKSLSIFFIFNQMTELNMSYISLTGLFFLWLLYLIKKLHILRFIHPWFFILLPNCKLHTAVSGCITWLVIVPAAWVGLVSVRVEKSSFYFWLFLCISVAVNEVITSCSKIKSWVEKDVVTVEDSEKRRKSYGEIWKKFVWDSE